MGDAGNGPTTTIPPFADSNVLPACAIQCGPLYDANGACVPPAAAVGNADTYEDCFCSHSAVSPFSTAANLVCNNVCQEEGLNSIATWFRDLCGVEDSGPTGTTTNTGAQTTTTNGGNSGNSGSGNSGGGGGDWLSNHWQWVIMLVVLVVAIAGIWIGACIWRRRYLRKKDRQSTIGQKQSGSRTNPSWGPGFADTPNLAPTPPSDDPRTKGSFMPGTAAAAATDTQPEKSSRKKWTVKGRT